MSNTVIATPEVRCVADRLEMEARVRRFLADFAQHCIDTVPANERADDVTTWLMDMKRNRGKRHQRFIDTVCDLLQVAGRSGSPFLLGESFHGEVLRQMPTQAFAVCPVEAYRIDTKEQAENDIVQARYITEPTETWRQAAIREGTEAMAALRQWLNALHLRAS